MYAEQNYHNFSYHSFLNFPLFSIMNERSNLRVPSPLSTNSIKRGVNYIAQKYYKALKKETAA